jgi:hypothetical protein
MWEGVIQEEGQGLEIVVTATSEGTTALIIKERIMVVREEKNREVVMNEIRNVVMVAIKGGTLVLIESQMSALNVTKKGTLRESVLIREAMKEGEDINGGKITGQEGKVMVMRVDGEMRIGDLLIWVKANACIDSDNWFRKTKLWGYRVVKSFTMIRIFSIILKSFHDLKFKVRC